eukprot:CAMPEP_0179844670 /NCGR_PEP_ID=MMETSP0982-20121206/4480_1 /TAXON_ID=483367 /ORGANISM="non described non described, Strain CCMP 2436" /LENGTH=49 /DNA_ID= /DNA_START= /DNA_END= /DNA_ORIENTATION=
MVLAMRSNMSASELFAQQLARTRRQSKGLLHFADRLPRERLEPLKRLGL